MSIKVLNAAVKDDAIAFRCRRRLQPAEGPGGKVFPSTYSGGVYAEEERWIDEVKVACVTLDSVQSQANRIEQALKNAYYTPGARECAIPVIDVDFAAAGLPEVGHITSLDAPHRIADAILRDSKLDGRKFPESDIGEEFEKATAQDATALYQYCPLALVLGIWDSTGPKGGLGTKIQRALVSEITAVNAVIGKRTSSRIDPLNIALNAGPVYKSPDGEWSLEKKNGSKEVKPSEVNHGNIVPSLSNYGGVTCDYVLQTTVLSLPALRKLHFPVDGACAADDAARTVLAALAICGATLAQGDMDLRSRCLLVPEGAAIWERIGADGGTTEFTISAATAKQLLDEAREAAEVSGLTWKKDVVTLTPSDKLVELVRRSREIQKRQHPEE